MNVLAATPWPTNAALIADVARLGYLRDDDTVLDPTWGRGNWWTLWRPARLIGLDVRGGPDGYADFTALPIADRSVDVVAFDPPYVCVGGRKTTGIAGFHDRYGLTDAPKSPAALSDLIGQGIAEAARVARRCVLIRCQDYISSGKYHAGSHLALVAALDAGLTLLDRLEMIGAPRPQPPGRRQVHARRNLSTLLVMAAAR